MTSPTLTLVQLARLLLHLSFFSQIAVITRVFLDKFFILGCDGGWGPCLKGGIYFKSLPSNMLGSFIIGVAATSSTLGISSDKSLVLLPSKHPWQANFELQTGIRTGFCGALTTFSSWVVELMVTAIVHNTWMNAVLGLIVGLYAAIVSYILGMHTAAYIDRWWLKGGDDVLALEEQYRVSEVHAYRSLGTDVERLSPQQAALAVEEPDLPRLFNAATITKAAKQQQQQGEDVEEDSASSRKQGVAETSTGIFRGNNKTHVAVALLLVISTACLAAGTALETSHTWLREAWLGSLFAPLGCILRWYLSRFNYKMRGSWVWFPAGTFAANMAGTALCFALECLFYREVLGYWGKVVVVAVELGFCGALTTVSTFVTEIVKYADVFPDNSHAYTYSLMSLAGGVVLGLAVFAWAHWVPL